VVTQLPVQFVPLLRVLVSGLRSGGWRDLKLMCLHGLSTFFRQNRRQPESFGDRRLLDRAFSSQPLPLLEMAMGAWVSQVVYVAAKLRIADMLSDGPRSWAEIAAATSTPASSLLRLLRALRTLGVLNTVDGGRFVLTPLGRPLQTDRPGSLRALVMTLGEIHYDAWGELLYSVKTDTPAFPHVFGAPLFDHLDRNRNAGETFHEAMTDVSTLISQAVLLAYDFSGIQLLADIGGGYGQFLSAILQVYPGMRGILLDTPTVIAAANKQLALRACRQRCTLVPGNLLEAVPHGATAYLMSGVIHDWDDEHAVRILDNCRRAMAPNGKVLVVETVVPAERESPLSTLLDLNMLVMTGGRERTEPDFRRLFDAAGLTLMKMVPTLAPLWVMEGACQ
jgi:SAM-dependent methyltransferase